MLGIISFMQTEEITYGGIADSDETRRRLAKESLAWNMNSKKNGSFTKVFDQEALIQMGAKKKSEVVRPTAAVVKKETNNVERPTVQNAVISEE